MRITDPPNTSKLSNLLPIFFLLLGHLICCAQSFNINQDPITKTVYLDDTELLVYEDTTGHLSFKDISAKKSQANFTPREKDRPYKKNSVVWLKFTIKNTSDERRDFVLFSNDWDVRFFSLNTKTDFFKDHQGVLPNTYNSNFYSGENADAKITDYLLPQTSKTYYVRTLGVLYDVAFKGFDFVGIRDKAAVDKRALLDLWSIGIYIGILFLILVGSFYLLGSSFKWSYVLYGLYCITHVLFFTGYYQIPVLLSFKWPFSHSIFLPMTASLYLLFVHSYLSLEKHGKLVSSIFKIYIVLSLLAVIVLSYLNLTDMVSYYTVLPKVNIANLGFLVLSTFLILKVPGKLKYFILTGSVFIIIGATITWITQYHDTLNQSFFFAVAGNALEKIAFLFGIFYVHNQEQLAAKTKLLTAKRLLKFNQQQLKNFSNSIKGKNRLIETFEKQIEKSEGTLFQKQENLLQLTKTIILTDDDWKDFKKLYEEVHPNFFFNLKGTHPQLTNAEIRLIALMKLQLSNKEIAGMLGISPDSAIKTKYRLRKKLAKSEKDNLEMIVQGL